MERQLERCKRAAELALGLAQREAPRLHESISRIRGTLGDVRRSTVATSSSSESARALREALLVELADMDAELALLEAEVESSVRARMDVLSEEAGIVTVVLFGRTKAGKSTTLEALTHGDGASIGIGRQHTTTRVTEYFWPPSTRWLRIVDTPGIEGFGGAALAQMAEEYVDRADLVLFLVSDDKATTEELERFGWIHSLGKRIVVLLNIKEADLQTLLEAPEYVFDAAQIDGHVRRISGFLDREFEIEEAEIIPIHARAGWEATRTENWGGRAADLRRLSRIPLVEARLASFLEIEAVGTRLRSARDVLVGFAVALKDALRPYAGRFRGQATDASKQRMALHRKLDEVITRHRTTLRGKKGPLARSGAFGQAWASVPSLADDLIASGHEGSALGRAWMTFIATHGLRSLIGAFQSQVLSELASALEEEVRTLAFDQTAGVGSHQASEQASPLDDLVAPAVEAKSKGEQNSRRYARAGLRTAGSLVGAAGLVWAVANWWNPTGWVLGAATIAAAIAGGVGGERLAREGADRWADADRRELQARRDELVADLRELLEKDRLEQRGQCLLWLGAVKTTLSDEINASLGPVASAASTLQVSTVAALGELDQAISSIEREMMLAALQLTVPEQRLARIDVVRTVRREEYGAKLLLRAVERLPGSVRAHIAGPNRCFADEICRLLGVRDLALVDDEASLPAQVAQALSPARMLKRHVISADPALGLACVEPPATEVGRAIGYRGWNVRTATELLSLNEIVIHSGRGSA